MKTAEEIMETVRPSSIIQKAIDPFRAAARTIFGLGIALVILGSLSIVAPAASGLVAQALIGLLMIAGGITWMVFAFRAHSWGSGLWQALVGVLAVITGVLMLGHPLVNLAVLTLTVASFFIATGVLKAIFAFELRKKKGWGWVLFSGITSIVLGALITYQWPLSGLWAIGTLLGVDMLFGGVSLISLGTTSERIIG